MTEPFVTTVASVSSAILIAATLEAATYRKAIQDWARAEFESLMSKSQELRQMESEERKEAIKVFKTESFPKHAVRAVKALLFYLSGAFWGALMAGQALVIFICLIWLANPDKPKEPDGAVALTIIVTTGAFVVALVPFFRLMNSPFGPIAEMWFEAKLRQEIRRQTGPEGGAAEGGDEEPAPGPS